MRTSKSVIVGNAVWFRRCRRVAAKQYELRVNENLKPISVPGFVSVGERLTNSLGLDHRRFLRPIRSQNVPVRRFVRRLALTEAIAPQKNNRAPYGGCRS